MNRTGNRLFLAGFSMLVLLLPACKEKKDGQGAAPTAPVNKLPVITLQSGASKVTSVYSSSVEGVVNVEVRPQVSGSLQKIYVDEGAFVKAGQPMFFIDDRVYRQQLNTALGVLHNAEANMESARINVDKTLPLVQNKVSSDITLQTARAGFNGAKAMVEQAEAAVQSARINIDYCTIKAPVSGYIGRIPFKLGSLVSPSGVQPLTLLSDVHNVNVYFSMSEADFIGFQQQYNNNTVSEMIRQIPPVHLQLADGSIYEDAGKISAVQGQFDRGTGSITLRATFPNGRARLRSGSTGKIMIDREFSDVLLVPIASTLEVQDKVYAFAVGDSSKVKQTVLHVSGKSGTSYVVTAGLRPGSRIVAGGLERLQDGAVIVADTSR